MSGLSPLIEDKINKVFIKHESIEVAVLYGSRALGTNRENSDIDITLQGDIQFETLLKVENELEELLLPYKIDLSIYNNIQNKELIDHIKRVGKTFYTKIISGTRNYRK